MKQAAQEEDFLSDLEGTADPGRLAKDPAESQKQPRLKGSCGILTNQGRRLPANQLGRALKQMTREIHQRGGWGERERERRYDKGTYQTCPETPDLVYKRLRGGIPTAWHFR